MKTETTQCLTCGSKVAGTPLGALCLACVLRASRTPVADPHGVITTWAEVFPQLEVERTLRESEGYSIYLARVIGDQDRAAGKAVLQVVSGAPLERAGGVATLQSRAQRLAGQDSSGLASILDFGDLADAFFLVTEAPAQPTVPEVLTGLPTDELAATLSALTTEAEAIIQRADVPVRFDPEISFADPDTAQLTLTPNLLAECSEPESATVEITRLEAGRRLGPFVLVEEAGEGGFGEVWRARQEQPVEREVALKILKGGLHSQRARARFEVEQQALAKLEHPHIARFFDGGTTPAGRPFFAMEWIDGQSLTRHCEKTTTPLQERLRLFAQVCEAMHHAHQKGIIHRDLKPSNVMVTANGQPSSVKVIDFGIARALEHPETDQTQLTRAEEILGTPASMSPEQVAGAGMTELDARTDVYGLGTLLYELLTGNPPFDPKLPPDELRRCIREDDPCTPSARAEDPVQARQLRGDLDWIVMRCLEKDPSRRYSSVSVLLRDLERHSQDEPVEAGPPEFSYRARKFVRRNKVPVLAGAVVALTLVAAAVMTILHSQRAEAERVSAREAEGVAEKRRTQAEAEKESADLISQFLVDLLERPNPGKDGRKITVAELLHEAARKLNSDSRMVPDRRALLLRTLGNTHRNLGLYSEAVKLLEESAELYREHRGSDDPDTLDTLLNLSGAYSALGRYAEEGTIAQEVVNTRVRLYGSADPEVLEAKIELAAAWLWQGHFQKATRLLEEVVTAADSAFQAGNEIRVDAQEWLATAYSLSGKLERAIEISKKTLLELQIEHGQVDAEYLRGATNLAALYQKADQHQEAISLLEGVLAQQTALVDTERSAVMAAQTILARSLSRYGRKKEAVQIIEEVLSTRRRILGPEHPDTLTSMSNLALYYDKMGRLQDSIELSREALAIRERVLHPRHPDIVTTSLTMIFAYFSMGRDDEALAACRELLARFGDSSDTETDAIPRSGPDGRAATAESDAETRPRGLGRAIIGTNHPMRISLGSPSMAGAFNVIISKLRKRGEYPLAIPFAETKLALLREQYGDENRETIVAYDDLGFLYRRVGRPADAVAMYRKALDLARETFGIEHRDTILSFFNLALSLDPADEKTVELLEECLAHCEQILGPDHELTLSSLRNLAILYTNRDRHEDAAPLLRKLVETEQKTKAPSDQVLLDDQRFLAARLILSGQVDEGIGLLERLPALDDPIGEMVRQMKLANGYMLVGRFAEAAQILEAIMPTLEAQLPERANNLPWSFLPVCYQELGRHDEAVAFSRRRAKLFREEFGPVDEKTLKADYGLALAHIRAGHHAEAIPVFEELLVCLEDNVEVQTPSRLALMGRLAESYGTVGRGADRTKLLEQRSTLATRELEVAYRDAMPETAESHHTPIPLGAMWRWHRPEDGADPSSTDPDFYTTFYHPGFDDATWQEDTDSLLGGFGYSSFEGQWIDAIDIHRPDTEHALHTAFFRHRFTTNKRFEQLELHLQHDDGVVIFLDGKEVARENVRKGTMNAELQARACRNASKEWEPTRIDLPGPLEPGSHLLAISLHNHDCWNHDLRLAGVTLVAREEPRDRDESEIHERSEQLARLAHMFALDSRKHGRETEARDRLLLSLAAMPSLNPSLFLCESAPLPKALVDLITIPLVERGSSWGFFSTDQKHPTPPAGWNAPGFDGSGWPAATAPLGYGDETVIGAVAAGLDAESKPLTAYFRKSFTIGALDQHESLRLHLRADDGAAVYLNGEEVQRVRLPDGPLGPETLASEAIHGDAESEYGYFILNPRHLRPGTNLLAVEVHQKNAKSSDLIFDLELLATPTRKSLADDWRSAFDDLDVKSVLEDLRRRSSLKLTNLSPGWRDRVDAQLFALAGNWEEALAAADRSNSAGILDGHLARFRWHCLRGLDRETEAQLAITQAIPTRDPKATPMQLDLTKQYNASLDEELWLLKNGTNWSTSLETVPIGLQEFNEIQFELRGVLQVTGTWMTESGAAIPYPASVEGIEVGHPLTRLHFLHLLKGTPAMLQSAPMIAHYLIHYADGDTEKVPVRRELEAGSALDQNVAWQGSILDPILYQQTWENPRPDVPIVSIDVVSAMNRPSLSVFAITGEGDIPVLQASPPEEH